jgi:isoquinoline 1-oxidoreductase beta subunit
VRQLRCNGRRSVVRRQDAKVHRVIAAIDCGTVVDPDIVLQQAQGATNFGPSAGLTEKITIANGRVQQSNFYDYKVLRMAEAPAIEVYVLSSTAPADRRRRNLYAADRAGPGAN